MHFQVKTVTFFTFFLVNPKWFGFHNRMSLRFKIFLHADFHQSDENCHNQGNRPTCHCKHQSQKTEDEFYQSHSRIILRCMNLLVDRAARILKNRQDMSSPFLESMATTSWKSARLAHVPGSFGLLPVIVRRGTGRFA